MSTTHEIDRGQWGRYFDKLSRQEMKHPVHIEVDGEDIGNEVLSRQMPLMGLTLERKGSAAGDIDVVVGRAGDQGIIDHRVPHAEHIYVQESDNGDLECIDIEDSDHNKTLVYFD